ncbi:MAG: FkbM family methyltransferase [Chloroflexota bacterium]
MLDRIDLLVRPPILWDGHHHPLFQEFTPWHGYADGQFVIDYLGIKTDPRFRAQFKPHPPGQLVTTFPTPHYAYFELIAVLQSVQNSAKFSYPEYAMMELGAGYGLWMVTAYKALRQLSPKPIRLIGVEMEPTRFQWMHEHLRNNGIEPAEHLLLEAAVSAHNRKALFHSHHPPELDYGLGLVETYSSSSVPTSQADEIGRIVTCVNLPKLLKQAPAILDLLHLDIQGEEWRTLKGTVPELQKRVRMIIIATHSLRKHRQIAKLFNNQNWKCEWNFRPGKRERTDFGDVRFLDGLLVFSNNLLD